MRVEGTDYQGVPQREEGFEGGAIDFASSPLAWAIFHLTYTFKWIGVSILVAVTMFLMFLNRRAIVKAQKAE